jgi:hypothetical protein
MKCMHCGCETATSFDWDGNPICDECVEVFGEGEPEVCDYCCGSGYREALWECEHCGGSGWADGEWR